MKTIGDSLSMQVEPKKCIQCHSKITTQYCSKQWQHNIGTHKMCNEQSRIKHRFSFSQFPEEKRWEIVEKYSKNTEAIRGSFQIQKNQIRIETYCAVRKHYCGIPVTILLEQSINLPCFSILVVSPFDTFLPFLVLSAIKLFASREINCRKFSTSTFKKIPL